MVILGHRETFALRGKRADQWLRYLYYCAYPGSAPGSQAVSDALNVLRSVAVFDGDVHTVHVRIAAHGDELYVDVGDDHWSIIRGITSKSVWLLDSDGSHRLLLKSCTLNSRSRAKGKPRYRVGVYGTFSIA